MDQKIKKGKLHYRNKNGRGTLPYTGVEISKISIENRVGWMLYNKFIRVFS